MHKLLVGVTIFLMSVMAVANCQSTFRVLDKGKITVSLPSELGPKPYFSCIQQYRGKPYIWLVSKEANAIVAISPKNFKIQKRWEFETSDLNGVRTFFISSADSVVIYCNNSNSQRQLFWYNPKKNVSKPIKISSEICVIDRNSTENKARWETVYAPSAAPISVHRGRLLFGTLPYLAVSMTPDESKKIFAYQECGSDDLERIPLSHPEAYRQTETDFDYRAPSMTTKGDSILVSFGGSPELFIYDSKTQNLDTLLLTVPGNSLRSPPKTDSLLSPAQSLLATGYYGRLFYHQGFKIYLRVVYLPSGMIDHQTGEFKTMDDRKACLFIWDTDFHPLAFHMLPDGVNDNNAFCTPKGFMILRPGDTKSDAQRHLLSYYQYEFAL